MCPQDNYLTIVKGRKEMEEEIFIIALLTKG
jgi:hypothetical protein